MVSARKPPTISAFPKVHTAWRIDWFGSVAFPNRLLRRKQPSILVHLSQVSNPDFLSDQASLLSSKTTVNTQDQRGCWVSVGTLPLLQVGDIWLDQKLLLRPDYQLESFGDLLIDNTSVKLIKAGLSPNGKDFLLPLSEHPWHRRCTQSYCLEIALSEGKRIIIPCIEIIRFYFGSSSSLLTQLFLPPLTKDKLFTKAHFDSTKKRLTIALADRISGSSAADIGRLHLSHQAWRAALAVGASLLRGKALGQEIYPQTFFPFEGKTNLVASGKWLSFAGIPNATFVVYSLLSCSHPFPFESLRYEIKNKDVLVAPRKGEALSKFPQDASPQFLGVRDSADKNLKEQDASNQLASKTWFFHAESRFPDLTQKYIWKSKALLATDLSQKFVANRAPAVDAAAVGESGSSHRIRSIDLAMLNKPEERQQPPEFMRSFVNDLTQLNGVQITVLTASDEDGWTVPATLFFNSDGEIDERLFVQTDQNKSRLRRVALLALSQNQEQVSAVLVESVPLYAKIYVATGKDLEEGWQLLKPAISDFLPSTAENEDSVIEQLFWIFNT